ncbi:SseB family protein [Streptomyces capillispiralis]|uniref:SseB family protein n=1 Tax=Streptomyces capillispiralis TaxID=68182 RepID=UPI0036C4E116
MRTNGGGADEPATGDADTASAGRAGTTPPAEPRQPEGMVGTAPDEAAGLAEVVRRAKAGEASPQDVFDAFLRARVYCERPEEPGFLTVTAPARPAAGTSSGSRILDLATAPDPSAGVTPPDRLVPVFTSLERFELFTGGGAWFSTTGADVLDLLPPGLDVWLDPAAEHAVRLSSAATRTEPVLHVSYRPRGSAA